MGEVRENSSVVKVELFGEYSRVESTLPLLKRPVPSRIVDASVLHLSVVIPEVIPEVINNYVPGEKPGDTLLAILGGKKSMLQLEAPVLEKSKLRLQFNAGDSNSLDCFYAV